METAGASGFQKLPLLKGFSGYAHLVMADGGPLSGPAGVHLLA